MNRIKMIEILFSNLKYTQEHKDIILQLEEAKLEWEVAKNLLGWQMIRNL